MGEGWGEGFFRRKSLGKKALIALLIVGLIASGYVAAQRYRVESKNRAVEIVVDWDEVQTIAAAAGSSPVDVLKRFKIAGVTSVAIAQQTFRDAINSGIVSIESSMQYNIDKQYAPRISNYLYGLLPGFANAPLPYLQQLPIGFPEDAVAAVKSADLGLVGRIINYQGATPQAIDFMMADAKKLGAKVIVFQGDSILGFKGAIQDTANALRDHDLYFGRVEFSKQKGDQRLAEETGDRIIIVHSITQAEMPTLSQISIIDRFQKSVRERGVKMCYIRMYETAGDDLAGDNAEYINSIANSIEKAGYTLKSAHPLGEVRVPYFVRALVMLGVVAGLVLLMLTLVETNYAAILILAVLLIAGWAIGGNTGAKAIALLSAIVFPILAVLWATRKTPQNPIRASGVVWRAIGRLLGAVAITSCGGLLIMGLLSGRDFMLRTDQFAGVKLAHLLPVIVLALLYAGGIAWQAESWTAVKERFGKTMKNLAANPVLMWQALGMLAVVALVGLMVARSGNDSGLGVSGTELRFRSILDKVLYVRPRTKEFLIGYPALLAGIAFAIRGWRQWAAPLVAVGSIGLISTLNTFCHIHTPLQLSVLRVFNGTVVGILIGLAAYWLIRNLPGNDK